MKNFLFRGLLITFALCLVSVTLLQAGCKRTQSLYISQPQVFTRERLISQRSEEIAWLHSELGNFDGYYKDGIQGRINEKLLDMLAISFKAEINPGGLGGGAVSDTSGGDAEPETTEADPADPAAAADAATGEPASAEEPKTDAEKIATAQFAAQLSEHYKKLFKTDGPTVSLEADGSGAILPTERLKDERAYRDFIRQAMQEEMLDDVHDLHGKLLYDLKFDLTMLPSNDKQTQLRGIVLEVQQLDPETIPISQVAELRTAWQQALTQEVSDVAIDLHYRITSDTSESKNPRHNQRFANILRGLDTEKATDIIALYIRRANPLELKQFANVDLFSEQFKSQAGLFGVQPLMSFSIPNADFAAIKEAVKQPEQLSKFIKGLGPNLGRLLVAALVAEYYENRLHWRITKLASRPEIERARILRISVDRAAVYGFSTKGYVFDNPLFEGHMPEADDDGNETFKALLKSLQYSQNAKTQALAVKPMELAHNIADTGSSRKIISLLLEGRGQVLPELGLGGKLESFYDHQVAMQAVQRKPLLLGFNSGEHQFGWVVGPRFKINRKDDLFGNRDRLDFEFTHVPVRHSVAATIVAPAWHRNLKIKVATYRIDELSGKWTREVGGERSDWGNQLGNRTKELTVTLPGNMEALTTALLAHENPLVLDPVIGGAGINSVRSDLKWTLRAGQPKQTMLILGRNLWRSPQVYVGGVRADRVEITSDLQGLLVSFDKFPTSAAPGEQKMDLTVVTSQGHDVLPEAVTVLPPAKQQPKPSFVTLQSRHFYVAIVNKEPVSGELKFKIDKSKLPASWHKLVVKARRHGDPSATWNVWPGAFKLAGDRQSATFKLSKIPDPGPVALYDIGVELIPAPDTVGRPVLQPGNKTVALLGDASAHKIALSGGKDIAINFKHIEDQPGNLPLIKLTLGNEQKMTALKHIYTQLGSVLKDGDQTLSLRFTNQASPAEIISIKSKLKYNNTDRSATLTITTAEASKLAEPKKTVKYLVELVVGQKSPQFIPIKEVWTMTREEVKAD